MKKKQIIPHYVIHVFIFCVFSAQAGKFKHFEPFKDSLRKKTDLYSKEVLSSITTQTWNAADKNWISTTYTEISNKDGNIVEQNTKIWSLNNQKWMDYQKVEISYNSKNYITSVATKIWVPDGSGWIDLALTQYTYDDSKELTKEVLRKENFRFIYGITSVKPGLHDLEKKTNSFVNGQLEKSVIQAASPLDSIYELEKYLTMKYTWGDNEQLAMELVQQWISVAYMDKIKQEYFYDNNGLLKKERQSEKKDKDWVPVSLYEYTYNDYDSLETTLIKHLDTTKSELVNSERISKKYNSEKNYVLTSRDIWINENWEALDKSEFTYENKLLVEEIYKVMKQGNWTNAERYLYKYSTPIKSKYSQNSMNQYLNVSYKNLHSYSILSFSASSQSVVSVDIYDLRGRYISSLIKNKNVEEGINNIVWNRKNSRGNLIAPGTYYFRLKDNKSYNLKKTMIINY